MNTFLVIVAVLLAAAAIYLLISYGVFGSAGRAGRSRDEASGREQDDRP